MESELNSRITPSTSEIALMRSKAIAALAGEDLVRDALLNTLASAPTRGRLSIPAGEVVDVLGAGHENVKAVRDRNAAIIAVHQLEQERVIQEAPVGIALEFAEVVRGNSSFSRTSSNERLAEPIGMHIDRPNQRSPTLQLTSVARGWTADDHEAFDLTSFMARPSGRLVAPDGELVLEEALENFRLGRFLSCTFMLGAFSETAWMEAASLCASVAPDVAAEVAKTQPGADRVMTTTLDFLAPGAYDFARKQLEPWVRATLAVRNIIGHANVLQNRTGSFTEASTAVRVIDSYRNVHELHEALDKKNL